MKLSEGTKFWLAIGSFALLTLSICIALLFSIPTVKDTPEYKEGYSAGYSEHNETKYQAAEKVIEDWIVYENNQTAYAEGYCSGYDNYWWDQEKLEWEAERNETLKTLGI